MIKENAREEDYELMEIDDHVVIFTNMRIDRSTVPEGLYLYEIRDSDNLDGSFAEIKPAIYVNHWGSIISKEKFPLDDHGSYFPNDYMNKSVEKILM